MASHIPARPVLCLAEGEGRNAVHLATLGHRVTAVDQSTAMGKGNFHTYANALFGATRAPEGGLAGWSMPGVSNVPQSMLFERTNHPAAGVFTKVNWFRAEGIPIAPYDDAYPKNPYPLMRVIAHNSASQPIATNDIVLPVSDEMDCRTCHASGTQAAAKPAAGWLWNGLPERDFRLNIFRLHDEHQFAEHPALYQAALADRGFNPQGLNGVWWRTASRFCVRLATLRRRWGPPSFGTIPSLAASVHSYPAHVQDPVLNRTLDNSANRASCYRCHPGSTTKCLRGAMGGAIASDGSMEMQCQSCHGNMSTVSTPDRVGWFMEPTCQQCHSGTATSNNGQIRYPSVFETNGLAQMTFATAFVEIRFELFHAARDRPQSWRNAPIRNEGMPENCQRDERNELRQSRFVAVW